MKGIAIPYIIAIILGVAVIGLIGYWLFVSGGQFGKGVGEQNCQSDVTQFCNRVVSGLASIENWVQTTNCKGVNKYPDATLEPENCAAVGSGPPLPE